MKELGYYDRFWGIYVTDEKIKFTYPSQNHKPSKKKQKCKSGEVGLHIVTDYLTKKAEKS